MFGRLTLVWQTIARSLVGQTIGHTKSPRKTPATPITPHRAAPPSAQPEAAEPAREATKRQQSKSILFKSAQPSPVVRSRDSPVRTCPPQAQPGPRDPAGQ